MKLANVLASSNVHSIPNYMLSSIQNALQSVSSSFGLSGGTHIPSMSSMRLLYNRSWCKNRWRMRISWVPKVVVAYVGAGGVPMAAPRI
eukprot:3365784-Ditylum_brightwellii.AAC.1